MQLVRLFLVVAVFFSLTSGVRAQGAKEAQVAIDKASADYSAMLAAYENALDFHKLVEDAYASNAKLYLEKSPNMTDEQKATAGMYAGVAAAKKGQAKTILDQAEKNRKAAFDSFQGAGILYNLGYYPETVTSSKNSSISSAAAGVQVGAAKATDDLAFQSELEELFFLSHLP